MRPLRCGFHTICSGGPWILYTLINPTTCWSWAIELLYLKAAGDDIGVTFLLYFFKQSWTIVKCVCLKPKTLLNLFQHFQRFHMLVQDLFVKMGGALSYPIRNIKSNKIGLVEIYYWYLNPKYIEVFQYFSDALYIIQQDFFKHLPKFKASKDPLVFFKNPESWLSG